MPKLPHLGAAATPDRAVDVVIGPADQVPKCANRLLLHGLGHIIEQVPAARAVGERPGTPSTAKVNINNMNRGVGHQLAARATKAMQVEPANSEARRP